MEFEAGLADGPRTATTPLDMIWHTEDAKGGQRSACVAMQTYDTPYDDYPTALVSQQTQTLRKKIIDKPIQTTFENMVAWEGGSLTLKKQTFAYENKRQRNRDRQVNRVTDSKKGSRTEMTGRDNWRLKNRNKSKNISKSDTQTSLPCVPNSSEFICHVDSQMNQPIKQIFVLFSSGMAVSILLVCTGMVGR